jgi:NAD(P)-dependent dehydrogenase (short-subunit alcohol dehydrogenase family)
MAPHAPDARLPQTPLTPSLWREDALQGRTLLVTGGASGIGRATASAFARLGAGVILLDQNEKEGRTIEEELRAQGTKAHFFQCDVTEPGRMEEILRETLMPFPQIDFFFNNAGVLPPSAKIEDTTDSDWQRTLDVNLSGVFRCLRAELRRFKQQGVPGVIINCASIAGLRGFEELTPYVASKHGLIGLGRSAALEAAKSGVRIHTICPGPIDTPMLAQGMRTSFIPPLGRIGTPEEIADAVVWLCSPGASFMTGSEIIIDGGWCAR